MDPVFLHLNIKQTKGKIKITILFSSSGVTLISLLLCPQIALLYLMVQYLFEEFLEWSLMAENQNFCHNVALSSTCATIGRTYHKF
jgi:hypothetical protein